MCNVRCQNSHLEIILLGVQQYTLLAVDSLFPLALENE